DAAGRGPLRELPVSAADRVAKLLDQVEPVRLGRDDQREVRLVDDRIDAGRAVRPADLVLPQRQPRVPVDLAGGHPPDDTALAVHNNRLDQSNERPAAPKANSNPIPTNQVVISRRSVVYPIWLPRSR